MRSWRDEKPELGDYRKELARGNRFAQVLAEAERARALRDVEHAWHGLKVYPAPKTKTVSKAPEEAPHPRKGAPR